MNSPKLLGYTFYFHKNRQTEYVTEIMIKQNYYRNACNMEKYPFPILFKDVNDECPIAMKSWLLCNLKGQYLMQLNSFLRVNFISWIANHELRLHILLERNSNKYEKWKTNKETKKYQVLYFKCHDKNLQTTSCSLFLILKKGNCSQGEKIVLT